MAQSVATTAWTKRPLRHFLEDTQAFVTIAELATSRGLITNLNGSKILKLARSLAEHPRFHALSITDNPGGHAMLSADTMGTDLLYRGQEVIIHLSCKDWNRNALESRCWKLASEGFRNVLALSGDYPVTGYHGQASPVFDIDSVGLLKLLSEIQGGDFSPVRWCRIISGWNARSCRSTSSSPGRFSPALASSSIRSVTTPAKWTSCSNTWPCTAWTFQ